MKQISLRLTDELYEAVEDKRGLIPRETWIKAQLERAMCEVPVVPAVVKRFDENQAKGKT